MAEIWLAFVAGLAGSAHCLGMCGGIVAAVVLKDQSLSPRGRLVSQVLYNLGRIFTYALLGVAAGTAGSSLDLLAVKFAGLAVFCAADLLVIALGVGSACNVPYLTLSSLEKIAGHLFEKLIGASVSGAAPLTSFPLGLLLGFLPCGLVYGPLIVAAGRGPVLGGAMMIALGLGTAPALFFAGSATALLSQRVRRRMLRLEGVAVALLGTVALWRTLGELR